MKKRILFFALSVLMLTASAQTPYHKMVVDSAEWRVYSQYCDDCNPQQGPTIVHNVTNYYKLEGDTVIDSLTYHVMYASTYIDCPNCPPNQGPFTYPSCSPFGPASYFREDTLLRKVYYRTYGYYGGMTETVIDFSLGVGDSMFVRFQRVNNFPQYDSAYIYVDSMGSSDPLGDTVKTWYFSNPAVLTLHNPSIMLYEGLGFSYGFRLEYVFADGTSVAGRLNGYCQDNSCWSTCRPTGIKDVYADPDLHLYPDPARDKIMIRSEEAPFIAAEFYSIAGSYLKRTTSSATDISDFPAGMYMVRVETEKGYTFKRFAKD